MRKGSSSGSDGAEACAIKEGVQTGHRTGRTADPTRNTGIAASTHPPCPSAQHCRALYFEISTLQNFPCCCQQLLNET